MGSLIDLDYWWSIRDKRTDGLFLVDSPMANLALVGLYVILVTVIGPQFMKNRKPYDIKYPMMAYNLLQICLSVHLVYTSCRHAWFSHYSWGKDSDKKNPIFQKIRIIGS